MLYSQRTDDGGRTYAERTKWPKYSGTQNVYSLGYNAAGALLKRRLPGWSKDDHIHEARALIAAYHRLQTEYGKHIDREMKILEGEGISPGPLISGIVSDKFPSRVKDELRRQATHIGQIGGAAAAHFAASGRRIETFRSELHKT